MVAENFLKSFNAHGLNFGQSGDGVNFATRCPFSGKNGKFVVNAETGQWQSFTASVQGNVYTFVDMFYKFCKEHTKASDIQNLAVSKKLPVPALMNEVAFNHLNGTYIIPTHNAEGKIVNLSYCYPGKTLRRTAKLSVGLYNTPQIINQNLPVYLCEGEWDMLALRWLFKTQGYNATVAGSPGANIFKEAWINYFRDRDVYVCYDNDKAGFDGQQKVANMIRNVVKSIHFLAWPEVFKDKYDIRDFVVQHGGYPAYPRKVLKTCYASLMKLFEKQTKEERDNPIPDTPNEPAEDVIVPSLGDIETIFTKWLKLKNTDPLNIVFGTYFANRLNIDPTWMFIIAPPGGSKSEILMTLNKSRHIEPISDLTAASLVSGTYSKKGNDASLIPRLDGRIACVKDFTVILEKNSFERDSIFAILRDAYDGTIEKVFGTGVKKSYKSKFGILAGVTPKIYDFSTVSASLGERFLKYRLDGATDFVDEMEIMKRAVSNIKQENKMREELQDYARRYLEKKIPIRLADFSEEDTKILSMYAMITARLRAPILKDKFTQEMTVAPFREVGTRLTKQLHQLGLGICVHLDKTAFDAKIMYLLRTVSHSTCPELELSVVEGIYSQTKDDENASVKTSWITEKLSISPATTSRLVADLMMKKILKRVAGEMKVTCKYRLNDELLFLIDNTDYFKPYKVAEKPGGPLIQKKKLIFKTKKGK